MKHLLSASLLVLSAALAALPAPAAAQSDILLRLRSGSPLGDRFRADSAGGVVAIGELGIGIIPATGAGYRMMWYPYRAAFRAGGTDDGGAGNYWDDANTGFYSWAGGNLTIANSFASFAFGDQVEVLAVDAAGFGASNTVTSGGVAGFTAGAANTCGGSYCMALGYTANAGAIGSVAIGYRVTADAAYAVALGHRASANGRTGSFTWADQSTTDSLENSANNSFQIRAAGGVRLYTNATTTTGVSLAAGGSSWAVISDVNRKENFLSVDGEDILSRIRNLPVTTWRYIDEEDRAVRHIGPMAQDWERAFGFSGDPTTINMSDFDGVNLAAIQALDTRTAGQESRIRALEAENARLREQNAGHEARIQAQEAENARLREQNEAQEERLRRLEALLPTP
ncbi:MAG TPA: tail fiber domain-containing protein [Longimicrobium sp.]|nr:tail fiber domain-containing protein [Longimicrobium sp.]